MTAVVRSASHSRLHGGKASARSGYSPQGGMGGMGDRSVSLPSLMQNTTGSSSGSMKRAPSELLLERQSLGALLGSGYKHRNTEFLDLAMYSNHPNSSVPVDQPLFSVNPPVIVFSDFEGLQTYEAVMSLRNVDVVARRVKVYPPDSPYFELVPGKGSARRALSSGGGNGDKVAPGMEIAYTIRFKPDARIDYNYDLQVITEREKFTVPIRASGGSALLDFPDVIDFGDECVVGHKAERTVLVRNVGDRATKFLVRTSPPFSITAPDGYLEQGMACQVSVYFEPQRVQSYECELHLRYGELEAVTVLRGAAVNVDISLSDSLLLIEDTFVGLTTQSQVAICNDSDLPIDFSWRLFPSVAEEQQYRLELQGKLQQEERDEALHMQQENSSEDSSDDSSSDGERLRVRREAKLMNTLGRKYTNLSKAVQEDPMLFRDDRFAIEPLCGRVWAHSQIVCSCSFSPKDALVYSCTAHLSCTGKEDRSPLTLKGLGIGPKATFSYDELDVGNVFVESCHRYEVQLLNQGDIEVDFRLIQKDSQVGSPFKFEPSSGTIAVGSQREITVDFRPLQLGDFSEVFEWSLKGSATAVTLAFRGTSVQPTFEFDADRISYGTVSYGFLNSRMLTLKNTSLVPCVYILNVLGDEKPPHNEFVVIPSKGTLLPKNSQRIQVDFTSHCEKRYDLRLSVDLEGIGTELLSIPITAQCSVPQVTFEPHGCLNYGDVFLRYPFHQSLYLHNTSSLPAKFKVQPQEDRSRAEFEPDQWSGSVPPCASHVITVTLTAHAPGLLRIPMYVEVHGRAVPFPLVLVANSVGPRVIVDPPSLDWGPVRCLEQVTRYVRLTNNSCIDASVRAFMNERKSLWTVHPKVIHLLPQETLQLAVTLKIDEVITTTDTLNLIVTEGSDLQVQVKGKGIETPIRAEQDMDLVDFGTQFTTRTEPREIVIRNHGQFARRITWFKDKEKEKKADKGRDEKAKAGVKGKAGGKGKGGEEERPPVFRVEPENVIMEPKSTYRFTFLAMSPTPGVVEETLVCNETVDKGGGVGKMIFKPKLKAVFVAPQLRLSTNEISFTFLWDRNQPVKPLTKPLTLQNMGPLEVRFKVEVPPMRPERGGEIMYPFSTDIEEGVIPSNGEQEILVDFDPAYKTDRKSSTIKQKLVIQYDEHPAVNTVELIGKVVWPNLELDTAKLDFGTVLNGTTKTMEVKMTNKTELSVTYNWCFSTLGRPADEASNPRTPAALTFGGASQAAMIARRLVGSSAASTSGAGGGALGATGQYLGAISEDGLSPISTVNAAQMVPSPATMMAEPEVDVNQIFDILPIFGKVEPGETQTATFTYYALKDRSFKAAAVCMVEGGPEYEVKMQGNASCCKYHLDKNELDFGEIPFTQVGELEVVLSNTGKVPASFNFNLSRVQRPFVVEVLPASGMLRPEQKLNVCVRFRAGIPDQVVETVLVEVAHFEPSELIIRGQGTFPGIVLGLPRADEVEHRMNLDAAQQRVQERLDALGGGGSSSSMEAGAQEVSPVPRSRGSAEGSATDSLAGADDEDASPSALMNAIPSEASRNNTGRSLMRRMSMAKKELELELEVDRHYLCEALLNSKGMGLTPAAKGEGGAASPTTRAGRAPKKGLEPPPVTAAHYVCDFGHIALGQTSMRQIHVYNSCTEPVVFAIDKKLLKDIGFLVEPEAIKPLQPGKMLTLSVTATPPESERKVSLEWNIPVKGGPNYKVTLTADFVLPELVCSEEVIDFGRLIVGQRARRTIELRNIKAVPVEWTYAEARDRLGKRPPPDQIEFDLSPTSGTLMPGERCFVQASFAPRAAQPRKRTLELRLRDNKKRKQIQASGRGDLLRVDVKPAPATYELGPIMPNRGGDLREFSLYNPTDYAIEVYSADFDTRYLEEERVMQEYDRYEFGVAELPVRYPGDSMWQKVSYRVAEIRRQHRREMLEAAEAKGEEPPEPPAEGGAADAAEALSVPVWAEDGGEEVEQLDLLRYPWPVAKEKRVHALILGPPKSGVTSLAFALAHRDQRFVLQPDDAVHWALQEPRYLVPDRISKKIRDKIKSRNKPSSSDVAHLLRKRMDLPDCNAGVIVDGSAYVGELVCEQLSPLELTDAVMEACRMREERLVVISVRLPEPEAVASSATASSAGDSTAEADKGDEPKPPPPPSKGGEALGALYKEALPPALAGHLEELKAKLPELEAAASAADEAEAAAASVAEEKKAVEAAAAAAAAADAAEAAATAAATGEVSPGASPALLPASPTATERAAPERAKAREAAAAAAALAVAQKALLTAKGEAFKAHLEHKRLLAAIKRCEEAATWQPPKVEVEAPPEPPPPSPKAKAKAKAAAKAAAKGKKEEEPPEEPPPPVADPSIEKLVDDYLDFRSASATLVERYNERAQREEEERQRESERKRRVRRAAALEAAAKNKRAPSPTRKKKAEPEEDLTAADFEPNLGDWRFPISVHEIPLWTPPSLEELVELATPVVPMPIFPPEAPLPRPTVVQIVQPRSDKSQRGPNENFKIKTPIGVPSSSRIASKVSMSSAVPPAPAAAASAAAAAAAATPAAAAEPAAGGKFELDDRPTRWIIEPHEEQKLMVHFEADQVASYSTTLRFEVMGDVASGPALLNVSGIASLPDICRDPKSIFPRRKKKRPPDGYAVKAFVTAISTYDYGPLLAGRDPELRKPPPPPEDGEGAAAAPEGAAEEEPADSAEVANQRQGQVSTFVMKHAETVRITNDSLFPADVRLGLASTGGDFNVPPPPAEGADPDAPPEQLAITPGVFFIDTDSLRLDKGESADVKVWSFPPAKAIYNDRLVALIADNPTPVDFTLCVLGETPCATLDVSEVDFKRLMMNVAAEDQHVRVKNTSALPVKWQLLCQSAKEEPPKPENPDAPPGEPVQPQVPEEFVVEPMGPDTLAAGEERDIKISFRAARPAKFHFVLRLETRDAEGVSSWKEAGQVNVRAETFAVEVTVEPDPHEMPLDFGTVLVNKSSEKCFDIVNRGRFPVEYRLSVRRGLREFMQINQPKGELNSGESRNIKVTCTPTRIFEASSEGITLQVFDKDSGESVDHKIPPIRVGMTAKYNDFLVTPPRGLNFGPVKTGESKARQLKVHNIGTFPFAWCLFDYAQPPTFDKDGKPPLSGNGGNFKIGPFTVKWSSDTLKPDEEETVEVTFDANGDQEDTQKLAIWVEGVQGDAPSGGTQNSEGEGASSGLPSTSAYVLTGQSCVPGINSTDMQSIFEEQFIAPTLDHAIAIAGRADVRVFCEAEGIFNFGPVLAHSGSTASQPSSPSGGASLQSPQGECVTESLRLTNPKAIECKVHLNVKPRSDFVAVGENKDKGKGGAPMEICPFEVEPPDGLTIPAHGSEQIKVHFKPQRLANFGATLEVSVEGGAPPSPQLAFELRGDGAVPSVSLQPAHLFGENGGELDMGKLAVDRSHEVRMALRNDSLLPATVRVEAEPSVHFTVACPQSVSLGRGDQRTFQVRFHPRSEGEKQASLRLHTLYNSFEDVQITLKGEGYSDEVGWDLTEVRRPAGAAGARADEEPSQAAMPPAPDDLQLGEVAIGTEVRATFQLRNGSAEPMRFEFPEVMPPPFNEQLVVEPRVGFVEAHSLQPITLAFKPEEPLDAPKVPLVCKTLAVSEEEMEAGTEEPAPDRPPRELPLMVSAMSDKQEIEVVEDQTEICFAPTVMFRTKIYRFSVENKSTIAAPFEWRLQGRNSAAFTVTPLSGRVPAGSTQEIEVRFSPLEVDNFDSTLLCYLGSTIMPGAEPALKMLLAGSALRPWCNIELPPCDYRSRRQADTPLDPKYHVAEIVSLGTHVKNTKRFYVYNPTAETLEFAWRREATPGSGLRPDFDDEDPFRCITKRDKILPGKKFEMTFEYAPQTIDTKESFWSFELLGPRVEERFLIAGRVEEPRVGMDKPCLNFGERLLEAVARETVRLVNKEHIPFSFSIDQGSYQLEGQQPALSVSPLSGVVGPDSSIDIQVAFKPLEERPFNFNVFCNVKRKKEPVVLNVKGMGYKIHASLAVAVEGPGGRRAIHSGLQEQLDLGVLQVLEQRTVQLFLSNQSKRNFPYKTQLQSGPNRRLKPLGAFDKPPYLEIQNSTNVAVCGEETPITVTYKPLDVHRLDGCTLQVVIPAGPAEETFTIALQGGAKKSRVDFSFARHDFGPCFIARSGATMAGIPVTEKDGRYERVELVATNRDDTDCLICLKELDDCTKPWLDVQLDSGGGVEAMIEAGASLKIPIVFMPREVSDYAQRIEFVVNKESKYVDVRGRGCPLRLELTDLEMQHVDFGVTTGGEPITRTVKVVNRSQRPATFHLRDDKGELAGKAVSWSPEKPTTLKPRETCDIDLKFTPTYRTEIDHCWLTAQCNHGVEVRLLQVSGVCHSSEMRLSEQFVSFGDVVVDSQATTSIRLHNFGNLGSKFRFEVPAKYAKVFSITPKEGFVRPSEEVQLTCAFHPTQDRLREFRRAGAAKRGKATPGTAAPAAEEGKDFVDIGLTCRDIKCVLDSQKPLTLEVTGHCVPLAPGETRSMSFSTEVRVATTQKISIQNPGPNDWKLTPQVSTLEPANANYFWCPTEVSLKAGETKEVEVTYKPLTMTGTPNGEPGSPSKEQRCEKHRGRIFVGTPDGNAILYNLEGIALQPKVDKKLQVEVPCKKQYTQSVPIKNWLSQRQRFDVKVELIDPTPGSDAAHGINPPQGVSTFDLPPGLARDYRFSIYAYHECQALVRITFTSEETGEFLVVEVGITFVSAKPVTIEMEAACRQLARHKIAVVNPLSKDVRFTGSSDDPCIRWGPDIVVPARGEKTIDLLFRPVVEGSGVAQVRLKSDVDELGTFPYEVSWTATPAGFERALMLKAPLGGTAGFSVDTFRFMHYAHQPVTYTASIESVPSHKGKEGDFIIENPTITAPACDSGESIARDVEVMFQPSMLGESRALLVIVGPGGGEYKALLTGFAQPPQPQGPFPIQSGKATEIKFRNPFDKAETFFVQVDNPAFVPGIKKMRLKPQKVEPITVSFPAASEPAGGRLIISCEKVSTPWIFFLKGEL